MSVRAKAAPEEAPSAYSGRPLSGGRCCRADTTATTCRHTCVCSHVVGHATWLIRRCNESRKGTPQDAPHMWCHVMDCFESAGRFHRCGVCCVCAPGWRGKAQHPPPTHTHTHPHTHTPHHGHNSNAVCLYYTGLGEAVLTEVVSAVCAPGVCGTAQHLLPPLSLLETAATAYPLDRAVAVISTSSGRPGGM